MPVLLKPVLNRPVLKPVPELLMPTCWPPPELSRPE
ncbi:Uncharacterised protein [Mycobacterium tuberculosis]|nr:Uncharacterised protein [Mycobacterium tuberculosis]